VRIDLLGGEASRSYSGFGQATLDVGADSELTAGVRYTRDELEGNGATNISVNDVLTPGELITAEHRFNMVSWRGALNRHFTQGVMSYLSVSRGFKSGVYNLQPFDGHVVNPESLTAYEIGTKLELLDRRLQLNAAGFWYNIENPQVERDTGAGVSLQNADSARSRGIDIDGQVKVAPNLTARFGAVLLDARYRSFRNALFYIPTSLPPYGNLANPVVGDASGNRMPRAPRVTFNVGASYSVPLPTGSLLFDANYYYAAAQYFNPDNEQREPGYGLLDLQVGYRLPAHDMQISIYGKNLTNREYFTSVFETAGPVGNVGAPGAPRTYGVKLDVSL
jgi:iron complex outermembrane receptor protein